ncbi:methyltransferase domain-containing protein [Paracraurococcus lichenis]|uniref:Methyltransferase domain-containing protein n=1 Tax=Paracraurococcus lichenis TaxID=3064888 RepID=A0ABT9DSL7_9PROT|nr:methyltransferase domain-containing protein [Paracraurococcus sp. LOR1-02]MDO9706895.1 methyltransferase domain-containing protein [Paracraurococcus sp. LOR1-02]
MSHRNTRLLAGLGRDDELIEIGPSFNPVAPKAEGWRVTIVDHASQQDLVTKYAGGAVDTARIEPVDVVWTGGSLPEAVPEELHGRFAALIACHVIEHLPDFLGFLRSAETLLDPGRGALLLAVPDKRFCFDFFRPPSTTGQFLAAHRAGRRLHTPAAMFDHVAYSATDAGQAGWSARQLTGLRLEHRLDQAMAEMEGAEAAKDYTDCHGWQFTPASFELAVLEFGALGLTDWRVEWLEPQPAVEFLVRLVRGRESFANAGAREARRLELLKRLVLELRDQADRLLGHEPPPWAEARFGALEAALRQAQDSQATRIAAEIEAARQVQDSQAARIAAEIEATRAALAPMRGALEELRPVGAAMAAMLPVRRAIARLRGRG